MNGFAENRVGILFGDFLDFYIRQFNGFTNFTLALGRVMLEIGSRGQVTAEAHGNRTRGNFRQSGCYDECRCVGI